jgi:ABC-type Fe3+/spermidine/putrescine transport system ATPase subunit
MLLEARSITKSFGDTTVLRGVAFGATESEIVALLGPSGCGKSTLLRIIAGLEQEYTGTVIFDGRAIDAIPVHRRGFGLMFQDFALFPHRTVGQNVAFGPRMQGLDRREIDRRVDETLELVGLRAYRNRTIFELSGGERQRVALARSLAPRPRLLLLDEPLGALDRTLRERLTGELRTIIKQLGITSVYVTHDQTEAFAVADRITLMNEGTIVQSGTPAEIYRRPASPFAARFLGLNNLIEGTLRDQEPDLDGRPTTLVQTSLGDFHVVAGDTVPAGPETLLLIRPEAAQAASTESTNVVGGTVVQRTFRGGTERIVLRHASGIEIELDVEAGSLPETGEIRVALRPEALALLPL